MAFTRARPNVCMKNVQACSKTPDFEIHKKWSNLLIFIDKSENKCDRIYP